MSSYMLDGPSSPSGIGAVEETGSRADVRRAESGRRHLRRARPPDRGLHHLCVGAFRAPLGIAITLFACHLFRFGICRVGPTLGSLLAVVIYVFMKRFEYWRFNEGQDTDVFSASPALFIARPIAEGSSSTRPRFLSMSRSGERLWFPGTNHSKGRSQFDAFSVESPQPGHPTV
ncbi:aquaporin rerated protein [Puccinia sorghi]|uniref:Aquaporin rerated protein n=1 Tax=Puccinia sorghi TaxID=27349 RepID=A0A0L6UUU7_9BASI|nr:aquaporin rerated protein [Puccinia sorghi]